MNQSLIQRSVLLSLMSALCLALTCCGDNNDGPDNTGFEIPAHYGNVIGIWCEDASSPNTGTAKSYYQFNTDGSYLTAYRSSDLRYSFDGLRDWTVYGHYSFNGASIAMKNDANGAMNTQEIRDLSYDYFQLGFTNLTRVYEIPQEFAFWNLKPGDAGSDTPGTGYEKPEIGLEDYTCYSTSITAKYRIYNQDKSNVKSAKGYYGTGSPSKSVEGTVAGSLITIRFTGLVKGSVYYIKCSAFGDGGTVTSETTKLMTTL